MSTEKSADALKLKVREVLRKDGVATYGHIRDHMPGISTKNITRIFRSLEQEGFLRRGLRRGSHGGIWQVAGRVPEWRPLTLSAHDGFSEELVEHIRVFVLQTQNASTTIIRYVFGIGDKTCLDILHHLRREGIVGKSREKHAHWRVLMSKKQAQELGINLRPPALPAVSPPDKRTETNPALEDKLNTLGRCIDFLGSDTATGKVLMAVREDVRRLALQNRAVQEFVRQVA
jgi:hypothetical protein